jgi:hypothetical protein
MWQAAYAACHMFYAQAAAARSVARMGRMGTIYIEGRIIAVGDHGRRFRRGTATGERY